MSLCSALLSFLPPCRRRWRDTSKIHFCHLLCSSFLHFVHWRRKDRCRVVVVVCDVTVLVSSSLYKYVNQAREGRKEKRREWEAERERKCDKQRGGYSRDRKRARWIHQMMPFLAMMTNEDEGEVFLFSFFLSLLFSNDERERCIFSSYFQLFQSIDGKIQAVWELI